MHQCSVDKDLSGPAFEGSGTVVTFKFCEKRYKTLLEHIFGVFPVTHVPEADGHHLWCQGVKETFLGIPFSLGAGGRKLLKGASASRGFFVPCPSNKMQFYVETFQKVRILLHKNEKNAVILQG